MSQNQLLAIPAIQDDENQLVERFMEASRDLVPSVQITLAKRIIRPGSNKVVCLAARTSIPLRDDELASVSDLALRLSDGTNVALSLSFFNDAGGEYSPLKRYVYSPADYKKKNDSNLGFVLLGMAMVFVAGSFAISNKPYSTFLPSIAHSAGVAGLVNTKEATKTLTSYAGGQAIKFGPAIPATVIKPQPKTTATRATSQVAKAKSANHASHARAVNNSSPAPLYQAHGQTLLVPPPPATTPYLMPYGNQMQFFDPRATLNQQVPKAESPKVVTHAKAESTKVSAGKTEEAKFAEVRSSEKGEIKAVEPAIKAPEAKMAPAVEKTAEKIAEKTQALPDISTIEPRTYRPREAAFWPSNSANSLGPSAPAPGNDSSATQLERIVPTSHDNF